MPRALSESVAADAGSNTIVMTLGTAHPSRFSTLDETTQALLGLDGAALAGVNPPEEIHWAPLSDRGIHFFMKREDLLDQQISGNKLYKLLGHLQQAKEMGAKTLVSFGGYYSNHLHALAAVGQCLGLKTVGVVRGEEPAQLNPTLSDCLNSGMQLVFITRERYRNKDCPKYLEELGKDFPKSYIIPEGGAGREGLLGCQALGAQLSKSFAGQPLTVCVPCGTGTTLAGLIAGSALGGLPGEHDYEGFAVVKPRATDERLEVGVEHALDRSGVSDQVPWCINYDFHAGGYAKLPAVLLAFMNEFEAQTGIALDPVYTAKMLWGIKALAERGHWQSGVNVLALHTGGLQGRRGYSALLT